VPDLQLTIRCPPAHRYAVQIRGCDVSVGGGRGLFPPSRFSLPPVSLGLIRSVAEPQHILGTEACDDASDSAGGHVLGVRSTPACLGEGEKVPVRRRSAVSRIRERALAVSWSRSGAPCDESASTVPLASTRSWVAFQAVMGHLSGGRKRRRRTRPTAAQWLWLVAVFVGGFVVTAAVVSHV
jgi:hypothetical protein